MLRCSEDMILTVNERLSSFLLHCNMTAWTADLPVPGHMQLTGIAEALRERMLTASFSTADCMRRQSAWRQGDGAPLPPFLRRNRQPPPVLE